MILTIEEMMVFKKNYIELMKKSAVKVQLTPYHVKNNDAWAYDVFGSAEYSFMFDVLIHNVDHALEFGYDIAR
ncbi:MAG: hypothetical protein ABXS91_08580 [Sulfurimonas sp.]